ncbi:MAG: hypothetical protein ACHQLA_07965, partial [Ignavibacteriales bacterium]
MNKEYLYTITLLFFLAFIFFSCKDENKNKAETKTVKDSADVVEYNETTIEELLPSFFISPNIIKVGMGDFDIMLERRVIRVLVPYSRTLFFN